MKLSRPRRWSDLSRVERVDRYTRQSLHLLLWVFAAAVVVPVLVDGDGSDAREAWLAAGAIVLTALGTWTLAGTINTYPRVHLPRDRLALLVVAAAVFLGAVGLTTDGDVRGAATMIAVVTVIVALAAVPDNRVSVGLIVGSTIVFGLVGRDPVTFAAGAFIGATIVFSVRVTLWLYGVVAELDEARTAQSQLAVAEERLRFSRDVHDVLGRRLSTIAVQAELAATLAARGDERAAAKMLEVRGVAHDALAEARELARGYRPTDLATELEGARSLLRSAGIDVDLAADVVPRGWHEAAGWVVRESVTNVLRHSSARRVRISFADGELRVDNDGSRAAEVVEGSGLRGLRERLGALGATLVVRADDDRWSVAVGLPGSGPLSASTAGAS
ncbi:histidine kinase [Nocardioides sp. C4-1]|uniref:sensor histidine kinase n=1 Tax=Nocardioides sp. C4-1 TaxID=3151851 RepID=UPI003267FB94